jgi:hypothetical protein
MLYARTVICSSRSCADASDAPMQRNSNSSALRSSRHRDAEHKHRGGRCVRNVVSGC